MREFFVAAIGNDANPGTIANPWKTVARVNEFAFAIGDVIRFRRGDTWLETLTVTRPALTFADWGSDSQALPLFSAGNPGGTARAHCILARGEGTLYRNLVCEGAASIGFYVNGANDQQLENVISRHNIVLGFSLKGNRISGTGIIAHHNGVVGIAQDGPYTGLHLKRCFAHHNCTAQNRAAIWLSRSIGAVIEDAECYDNGTPTIEGVGLSMYGTTDCTFRRCLSHNNYGNGILTIRNEAIQQPTTGALIEACKTYGNLDSAGNLASGLRLDTHSKNGRVTRCESYSNASAGIVIEDHAEGNRVEYNLIRSNRNGITFSNNAGPGNRAEHNTVLGHSDAGIAIVSNFQVQVPYVVKNNLMAANRTGLKIDADGTGVRHEIDHNLYYGNDHGVEHCSLRYLDREIDAFAHTGYERHGVGGADPLLKNPPADIRPKRGSPAIKAGTVPAVAVADYYGVTVPTGEPSEIGAAEFVPVLSHEWT